MQWRKVCNAECCRVTYAMSSDIKTTNRLYTVRVKNLSPDMQWYLELHGAKYIRTNGKVYFQKHKYRVESDGLRTFFYRDCDALVDRLCSLHKTGKPLVCQRFKENDPSSAGPNTFITPNCLANYKKVKLK